MSTNTQYMDCLSELIRSNRATSPRGMLTFELLNDIFTCEMVEPAITITTRKLNYHFMMAEAWWILTGSNKLSDLVPYMRTYENYSDDGRTLYGAYGPSFVEQVDSVVDKLLKDSDTRQAVMTFWIKNPKPSKDIPCTIGAQFMIRDNYLDMTVMMRSQDAWKGLPYDIFSFSMMAQYVKLEMYARMGMYCPLGKLTIFAGSRHLYNDDRHKVFQILDKTVHWNQYPIHLLGYNKPECLLNDLCDARNGLLSAPYCELQQFINTYANNKSSK